jgi:hypothetical protein
LATETVHSELAMVAYFKQSLASMREISGEAPALGSLLAVVVGLGAAPMEVSSAREAVQRQLDGSGLLCMYVAGEKFSMGHRPVPFDRLGVLSHRNKVKDSTLSPKQSLNRVPVKIRSRFSVSLMLEPRRRKALALGCCWALVMGPAGWEKGRNKWAAGLRAVKKSSPEWR